MWIEFAENKPVASFKEISRNQQTRKIGLKNDIQKPDAPHNFVALNQAALFEGPTTQGLKKIGDGAIFNFSNFL